MPLPTFNFARTITPSDTVNFVPPDGWAEGVCQSLFVGGAGVVRVVFRNDLTCDYTAAASSTLFVSAKRVNATGTTATLINAQYMI